MYIIALKIISIKIKLKITKILLQKSFMYWPIFNWKCNYPGIVRTMPNSKLKYVGFQCIVLKKNLIIITHLHIKLVFG